MKRIESILDKFFRPLEFIGHRFILAPFRVLLKKIDPFSEAIEGTRLKKALQVILFPFFIILTFVVGFKLVEGGYTIRTFGGTIVMFLIMGLIFAPWNGYCLLVKNGKTMRICR